MRTDMRAISELRDHQQYYPGVYIQSLREKFTIVQIIRNSYPCCITIENSSAQEVDAWIVKSYPRRRSGKKVHGPRSVIQCRIGVACRRIKQIKSQPLRRSTQHVHTASSLIFPGSRIIRSIHNFKDKPQCSSCLFLQWLPSPRTTRRELVPLRELRRLRVSLLESDLPRKRSRVSSSIADGGCSSARRRLTRLRLRCLLLLLLWFWSSSSPSAVIRLTATSLLRSPLLRVLPDDII